MKDHTDRAAIRVVITAVSVCLFMIFVWSPTMVLWISPWLYDGVAIGSMEWRKSWILGTWLGFGPIMLAFAYALTTMTRAIRRDAREREEQRNAREVWYRNDTYDARRLVK